MSSSLKNRILAGALLATLAVVPVAQAQHAGHGTATTAPAGKANATETQAALRDLWVDHVFWVRSVVVDRTRSRSSICRNGRPPSQYTRLMIACRSKKGADRSINAVGQSDRISGDALNAARARDTSSAD